MSSIILDYTVEDKNSYLITQGSIGKMQEKASGGFLLDFLIENFELTLKLQVLSVVHIIQIEVCNIHSLAISLLGKNGRSNEQRQTLFNYDSPTIIEFPASKTKNLATRKLILNATMRGKQRSMGIKYLIVKGQTLGLPNRVKNRANVSKRPKAFTASKEKPYASKIKSNAAFGERKKYNEITKKEERHQPTEEEQLRMAIQASKREAEQQDRHTGYSSWHPNKQQSRQTSGNHQQQEQQEQWQSAQRRREYPLVDFQKIKHFFANVNQKWLQAQRRAEIQAGIPEQHRLSKCIQVKHFHGKTLCLDLPVAMRQNIQKLALSMGAIIVQDVCDNCLLVAVNPDSHKVAKARKMKNARIVTPNFIQDSKQVQAYLNEQDYLLEQ